MNETPPHDPQDEGIQENSRLTVFGAVLGAGLLLALTAGIIVFGGERIALGMSESAERNWFRPALGRRQVVPWPAGHRILARLLGEDSARFIEVGVLCEAEPNAYTLPGRRLLITQGALKLLSTENAAAFILGHEYGHLKQKDHLRGLGHGLGLSLAFSLVGWDSPPAFGGGDVGLTALARGNDREQETAADLVAFELVKRTYGGLLGAGEFFEKVRARSPAGDDAFDRQHPSPEDRRRSLGRAEPATVSLVTLDARDKNVCPD